MGVTEAAIYADRLELKGDRGWVCVPFSDFARRDNPAWLNRVRRFFNKPQKLGHVARILFSRQHYVDSHIRFLTDPPIALYMPADGPTQYPDSHFWRLQAVIRGGGYQVEDLDAPSRPDLLDGLPRGWRVCVLSVFLIALINFAALFLVDVSTGSGSARSGTVENGHYYLRQRHGRREEVSPGFWKYRWWHETSLLVTHPLAMGSMLVAYLYASRIRRRRRQSPPVSREINS